MLKEKIGIDVSNVHFNSNSIKQNGLFVPIKGENQDGHSYIKNAVDNGAIATLWNKNIEVPEELKEQIKFIIVDDTLEAFQDLALYHRQTINPTVIGVTGSNGKTTTKEFLDSVLSQRYKVHKNIGNFNNHLGVPLTLLSMPTDTEVCIVEMGMNHSGEISVLTNIAKPNYALITNIGESHIGLLGSRQNIAKAKMEIIEGLINTNNVIFDGDEPLLQHLNGYPICNNKLKNTTQNGNNISFSYQGDNFTIPTFGLHNVKNSSFAIKLGQLLGLDNHLIQLGLNTFKNQPMRLEHKETNDNSFLLDCYNASLTSMKSALDTLDSISTNKRKIAILGDIFELGEENEQTHKEIGKIATQFDSISFWFVGSSMKYAYEEFRTANNEALHFHTKSELYNYIDQLKNISECYFLLKGSRGMKLEDIFNYFQSR